MHQFLEKLTQVLQLTRAGEDIKCLQYVEENYEQYIIIHFKNGAKKAVCVSADSRLAMITDVCKALY